MISSIYKVGKPFSTMNSLQLVSLQFQVPSLQWIESLIFLSITVPHRLCCFPFLKLILSKDSTRITWMVVSVHLFYSIMNSLFLWISLFSYSLHFKSFSLITWMAGWFIFTYLSLMKTTDMASQYAMIITANQWITALQGGSIFSSESFSEFLTKDL